MNDPVWVSTELALAIHSRQLAEHSGADGVRDMGLLESAIARPRQLLTYGDPPPDVATLAAAYAFAIGKNHAFIDGNKRTAYVVCRTFMILNSWDMIASREQRYAAFVAMASGGWNEPRFTKWIAANSQPNPR
jgi:death-on-curing protein